MKIGYCFHRLLIVEYTKHMYSCIQLSNRIQSVRENIGWWTHEIIQGNEQRRTYGFTGGT